MSQFKSLFQDSHRNTFHIIVCLFFSIFLCLSNQVVCAKEANPGNSQIQSSRLGSKLAFLSKWKEKKKSEKNNYNNASNNSSSISITDYPKKETIDKTNTPTNAQLIESQNNSSIENKQNEKKSAEKKNIFDERNSSELIQETLSILQTLSLLDQNKWPTQQSKGSPSLNRLRQGQLLILNTRKAKNEIENIDYVNEYIENTQKCLKDSSLCLKEFKEDEFMGSFYTWITPKDIQNISAEISEFFNTTQFKKDIDNFKRAKILYLIAQSLTLTIHEIDGPNNDSLSSDNYISQLFQAAGLFNPERELGADKVENWAWCAAYATAIMNQAGFGFSFLSIDEYRQSCLEANKQRHCHPVQVDFILQWAKRKGLANSFSQNEESINQIKPADLLIMVNKKSDQANHMGFYLAKSIELNQNPSEEKGNQQIWIYSIEGNAGPFINDKLENNWNEIITFKEQGKISEFNYERLLDRVTIVKRPIDSWDYFISQSK